MRDGSPARANDRTTEPGSYQNIFEWSAQTGVTKPANMTPTLKKQ